MLFQNLVHSVIITFDYKDQGWGNSKSSISIVENDDTNNLVVQSPTAKHHTTHCQLVFNPKPGCTYALAYIVGGGGGHHLYAQNVKLSSAVRSVCCPLANRLHTGDLFVLDLVRATVDDIKNGYDLGRYHRFYSLFKSVGVDLRDQSHIEQVYLMLKELGRRFN
uniref:Uncharacterized protein n=1 Tax=Eucampia antarctica TaxID=49252 RepID=A0A7S2WKB2_9STRA